MKIRKLIIIALMLTAGILLFASASFSQPDRPWSERRPYGAYCPGSAWGWYGAKSPVKTVENVRTLLKQYFEGQDVSIGKITEREWYFAADIKDKRDKLIDRVIVDRRSGRIRSIY